MAHSHINESYWSHRGDKYTSLTSNSESCYFTTLERWDYQMTTVKLCHSPTVCSEIIWSPIIHFHHSLSRSKAVLIKSLAGSPCEQNTSLSICQIPCSFYLFLYFTFLPWLPIDWKCGLFLSGISEQLNKLIHFMAQLIRPKYFCREIHQ